MHAPIEVTHDTTTVTVQWQVPDYDGSSEVTSYVLYWKADYQASYSEVYRGLSMSYKVTGLKPGFNH